MNTSIVLLDWLDIFYLIDRYPFVIAGGAL